MMHGTQNIKSMRHVLLSSVACLALPYLSTYLIKDRISEKKRLLNKRLYLDYLYNIFSEKFLILRIIELDIIVNVHKFSCQVSVFLARF
jgi:hypothetical protein